MIAAGGRGKILISSGRRLDFVDRRDFWYPLIVPGPPRARRRRVLSARLRQRAGLARGLRELVARRSRAHSRAVGRRRGP